MPWCPACRREFRGQRDKVGARCPLCREPLYERGEPPRPRGEADAACAVHPENRSAGPCSRCGNFLCPVCRTRWRDRLLCVACLERALEANEAAPEEARTHMLQSAMSLVLGLAGWALVVVSFVLIIAGMTQGEINVMLVGMGGLTLMGSPAPAAVGVGLGAAALRSRGSHMILATLGLLLSGILVGAVIGLMTFSLWQNS